jgi:phosphoribosyl 1,2-cyclic phosphodiesterase
MEISVSVLASSSSGNSIYIACGKTRLLIDAGLSGKEIDDRLKKIGARGDELDAILVTHEHTDHIKGVGVLSRRYDLPIYANDLTWQGSAESLGTINEKNCRVFSNDFMIGDLEIKPFSIPHDANDPVGYIISSGKNRIGVATDMGYIPERIKKLLWGLDILIIEANHDLDMLMTGNYPWSLKRRITGEKGHLSNDDTAATLPGLINSNFPCILLAHLSKDNNIPELAYITVKNSLEDAGLNIGKDLRLNFAFREKPTQIYHVG